MPHHPGLGRWVDFDPKSLGYLYTATPQHRAVLHTALAPISDQDGYGACAGYTVLDLLNTSLFWPSRQSVLGSRRYLPNDLGLDFYGAATKVDEWPGEEFPPDDTGTSVLSCLKVMRTRGFIRRYEWARTFATLLGALERQPVMLGTLWTSGMDDPDASGLIRPTGDLVGGHAYMARGVNPQTERIRCRNHWTKDWGKAGEFYLTFADAEWLLGEQGECGVPIPL